jgi:hypothetical protein
MWKRTSYLLALLLIGASYVWGQCSQPTCITYSYMCTSTNGYGLFDTDGKTVLTTANTKFWTSRTGGGTLNNICLQCKLWYSCYVNCDCDSYPCTGAPTIPADCPVYYGPGPQYKCDS